MERARFLPSLIDLDKIGMARAKVVNNEKDIDLESFYGYKGDSKLKQFDGWTRRYIGGILLNIDDQDIAQAEDWIKKVNRNRRIFMIPFRHCGFLGYLY